MPDRQPPIAEPSSRHFWLLIVVTWVMMVGGLPSEADADDGRIPDLSGTWAQKVVMTAVADVPIVGRVTSTTTSYMTLTLEQNGREIAYEPTVCDVRIDSDFDSIRTILPTRFAEAVPTGRRTGNIVETDDGPRVTIDASVSVMGARLRAPAEENLPTDIDDHRVVDADDDGHPGVTIRVEGMVDGRLFIVQRARDEYEAEIDSTDRLRGLVDWETEQKVLESTSIFLGDGPDTRPHPDARRSWFAWSRISDQTDCNAVVDRAEELFDQ